MPGSDGLTPNGAAEISHATNDPDAPSDPVILPTFRPPWKADNDRIHSEDMPERFTEHLRLSGITRYHFFGTFGNRYFSMLSNGDFQLAFIQEIAAFIENHPAVIYAQVNGNFSEVERMNWRNPGILTALELSDYINSGREDFAISKTEDIDMIFNQKFIKPSAAFNIAPLDNELDANTNHT